MALVSRRDRPVIRSQRTVFAAMSAVSILVPTYNRRDFLKECLDSLLATTVPCEIIVSDNASSDGTEALMATYDDPRLRYIRQPENIGAYKNYNFLLAQATKDYICLFGDDDIAIPGCFELKLAVLDHNPDVAGVFTPARVLDGDGNLIVPARVNGTPEFSLLRGRDEFRTFIVNCSLSWQTLVFRRELYRLYGGVLEESEILWARDWDFLIRISKDRHFACLLEPTVGIRIHGGSYGNKVAQETGSIVSDMLHVWRQWLLEGDDYPVIPYLTWESMRQMLVSGVRTCYGDDGEAMQRNLEAFEGIRSAYQLRMNRYCYSQLQTWVPEQVALGDDGLPIFRQGVTPLPLDATRRARFLHVPRRHQDGWRQVVETYLATFRHSDDLELVLWLDPEDGPDVDSVVAEIERRTADLGLSEDQAADILLLTDAMTLSQQAGLYAAVHGVIPAGDPLVTRRAAQVGPVVMTHFEPDVWRRAADQMLGIKRG